MLKHNKKKNSKIVYEQLMILASRLFLTEKKHEGNYVLEIIKNHFHPRTMLGKEKKIFDSVLESKTQDSKDAEAILAESLIEIKLIDEKKLEKEKVDLVNKILSDIGTDVFNIPVENYKLMASVQVLFNEMRNNCKFTTPDERFKVKKMIVENMKTSLINDSQDQEIDNLTYNLIVKKFNEKYDALINEEQKRILKGWINFLLNENKKELIDLLQKERLKIKAKIDYSLIKEEHRKSEYKDMLQEAKDKLSTKLSENNIDENIIYETMRYFDLIEELEEISTNEK